LTRGPLSVSNGLFVVVLDFGEGVFTGAPRWLQIGVASPANGGEITLLSPRQALLPAPYAIHATTAGQFSPGAAVKSVNGLSDDITLAAGSNVTLTPSGNTLTIDAPGPGGTGLWSANDTDVYYTAGNVGIGTNLPSPGVRLEVNGTTRVAPGGSGGVIQFGTPAGETGMAIFGNNRADIRFDDYVLKLSVGSGLGAPAPLSGIAIGRTGKVGVGTLTPYERFTVGGGVLADTKIEINAGGNQYAGLRFYNDARSWLWQVTPSNDTPGGRLRLTDEDAGKERMSITAAGNVGIGISSPEAKLHAETDDAGKTAVYGAVNSTSSVGVYGEANAGSSVGVWGRNPAGLAVYADGNAGQARDRGGFVKAMVYVDPFLPADQYIVRCFNSAQPGNAASTAPCGITATRYSIGKYLINFGFKIDDRFLSATPTRGNVYCSALAHNETTVLVEIMLYDVYGGENHVGIDSSFHLIVF
jgi:hypothetical protein